MSKVEVYVQGGDSVSVSAPKNAIMVSAAAQSASVIKTDTGYKVNVDVDSIEVDALVYQIDGVEVDVDSTLVEVQLNSGLPIPIPVVGPKGDKGDKGDPGDSGAGGSYTFVQALPATIWSINDNLGFHPNVTVVDSGESLVVGDIEYIDVDNIEITFSAGFSGKAYLS